MLPAYSPSSCTSGRSSFVNCAGCLLNATTAPEIRLPDRKGAARHDVRFSRATAGLDENVAGFLCYLLGFITGIVFLVVEKKSRFVRFHAMQSTITFLGIFVISIILGAIPIIQLLLFPIWILTLVLWLILMVKALRGERYSLPIAGKMAEEKAGR